MIPFKDDVETRRPPLLTAALAVALVVACVAAGADGIVLLAVDALALWIFGRTVEDALGTPRFALLLAAGAAAAWALATWLAPDAPTTFVALAGAAAAPLGAYALRFPGARVVTLVLIPFLFTVVAVPALVVLGAWLALQLGLGAADAGWPVADGDSPAYLAQLGAFAAGLAAVALLAPRGGRDEELASGRRTAVPR